MLQFGTISPASFGVEDPGDVLCWDCTDDQKFTDDDGQMSLDSEVTVRSDGDECHEDVVAAIPVHSLIDDSLCGSPELATNSLFRGIPVPCPYSVDQLAYMEAMYSASQGLCQDTWNTLHHPYMRVGVGPQHLFPVPPGIGFASPSPFAGSQHAFQLQEFQYFVVIDFEATCDKEKVPDPQEIIEFPSVLVNAMTGELESAFQTYVRPAYHQQLTDFCKELTGIEQTQVDGGVCLYKALALHDEWLEALGVKQTNFAVVTWSNWDCRVMLESECRLKRIHKPAYFNRWINLRRPFHEYFGDVKCNLRGAVEHAGLTWEGRAHCGLDDARNTANLLVELMCLGSKLSITNSIPGKESETMSSGEEIRNRGQVLQRRVGEASKYCCCGTMSRKYTFWGCDANYGRRFFACANKTVIGRAVCRYFEWES